MIDAGMVATEMLYFLVGSRELDGGAMVTASHNPKAYTGVKLVREGRWRSRATPGSASCATRRSRRGCPSRPAAARSRRGGRLRRLPRARPGSIDPDKRAPLKVVVDGGNGMAGPMVGPLLDAPGLERSRPTGCPTASSPTTSRTRCCPRTGSSSSTGCSPEGADLGIAWDGDADRCFFIDDTGEFVDGDFLTALLGAGRARQGARRDDPLRRARQPRGPGHRRARSAARRT